MKKKNTQKKTHRITLRVSENENKIIEAKAEKEGLKKSEYIRQRAMS